MTPDPDLVETARQICFIADRLAAVEQRVAAGLPLSDAEHELLLIDPSIIEFIADIINSMPVPEAAA